MNTVLFFTHFKKLFNGPTAEEKAQRDLEKAKVMLLDHLSATEYHAKMAEYYETLIKRLTKYRG